MILNSSSEVIYFNNKPLSSSEQINLGFPKKMRCYSKNVISIDGKYYYVKRCTPTTLLNELIGTYYSNLIGLDVVDYRIGKSTEDPNGLFALSEIFYQDGYNYTTVEDVCFGMKPDDTKAYSKGIGSIYVCDTSVLNLFNSTQIIDSALKLTAVDLKMGQVDRYNYNVILRDDGIDKELEKVFDFGWSYVVPKYDNNYCYYNPFLAVKSNTISLIGLAHRYPQIKESAAVLSTTPLYDVLKMIEDSFNIKIEDSDISGYIEMDKDYSKCLRKVR